MPKEPHYIKMEYGALAGQQGYSMNDTISQADVLNVRLKDINFKIFFDLTGEGDQDCGEEDITCSLISICYQYLLPCLMGHEDKISPRTTEVCV